MPTYLELAYEGNYVARIKGIEVFTYHGSVFYAYHANEVKKAELGIELFLLQ